MCFNRFVPEARKMGIDGKAIFGISTQARNPNSRGPKKRRDPVTTQQLTICSPQERVY